jgi:hypothetical protein
MALMLHRIRDTLSAYVSAYALSRGRAADGLNTLDERIHHALFARLVEPDGQLGPRR